MIREDRELLTELARLNRDMAALCMSIIEGSASIKEQRDYARRLIAAGERLGRRGDETCGIIDTAGAVAEGEVLRSGSVAL